MRLLACLIVAPQRGYDEPAILSYAISSFCPTSADGLQPAMTISIRRSPRASRLLLRTAVEHGTAGGAEVATVMGHARPDTANIRDVLLAEPDRVRFAGRALPRAPFLRGGGPRPERERETQERRSGYDRPEVWLGGTNVHYRPSIWLSWYLLLKRRPRQAASPCSRTGKSDPRGQPQGGLTRLS